jgi:hypothetical protein
MLPALKPRHKTITDRGKQRMLLGIEQCMKCMGRRVVANAVRYPIADARGWCDCFAPAWT